MEFKRLAFVHIEKCGGTTLIHMLRSSFGIRHFDIIAKRHWSHLVEKSDFDRVFGLNPSAVSLAGHSIRLYHDPGIARYPETGFYTILREPVSRYLSDFHHFGPCFSQVRNFDTWLSVSERQNFMTRAIAGEPNLNKAIDILHEKMALVGVMEAYDTFIHQLRLLFYPLPMARRYQVRNQSSDRYEGLINGLYERFTKISTHQHIDFHYDYNAYRDAVAENNAIDSQLYTYVKNNILPDQHKRFQAYAVEMNHQQAPEPSRMKLGVQFTVNRLYRNGVYKPLLGLFPVPYKLERYKNV